MRAVLVALVLALAGCATSVVDPAADPDSPAVEPGATVTPIEGDPLPSEVGHDHADPAEHEVAENVQLLAYPMDQTDGGGYGEIDVAGEWLAACAGNHADVWDLAERAAPVLASTVSWEDGGCPDLKWTDDAEYLVVGGDRLFDLRVKTDPKLVAENAATGCHMCTIHAIGGKEYLFSAANGPGMTIAEIVRDPPALSPVGEWGFGTSCTDDPGPWLTPGRAPDPDCVVIGQFHDVYVYDDPVLGKPVAVPAYWDLGIWFVDVSDPANPVALGSWNEYVGESGDIHTTSVDFLTVDGETRRIAVAASETGPIIGPASTATPSSVYVFDATDFENVELLARWVNPGKRPSGVRGWEPPGIPIVGEYSTHNLQFEKGRIYLAHYHAGVWVLDVQAWLDAGGTASTGSHVEGDAVPVLGVFNAHGVGDRTGLSMFWDVVLKDGHLYASDTTYGLFALRFAGDALNDPAFTSDA